MILAWLVIPTLALSLQTAQAQAVSDDVFSSDSGSGKTWWDVKRRDYPACAGLVDQHQDMTGELYRLDAQAKQAVEPQRRQIVQQINDLSRRRTQVQRAIFACIRTSSDDQPDSPLLLEGTVEKGDPHPSTKDKAPPPKQKRPPPKTPPPNTPPPRKKPAPTHKVQPPGFQNDPGSPEYGLFGKGQPDPIVMFADGTSKGLADCFEEDVKPENILTGVLLGKLKKFQRVGKAVSTLGKTGNLASIYDQLRRFNPNMTDYQLGRYLAKLLCEGRDLVELGGGVHKSTNGESGTAQRPPPGRPDERRLEGDDKKPSDEPGLLPVGKGKPWTPKTRFPVAPDPLERGMPLEDHKQLVKLAVGEKKIIIVRDSNHWAMRWVGRPRHAPKPQDLKAKTILYDPEKSPPEDLPFAGLASAQGLSDADRRALLQKGYTIRGEREIIVDPNGNRLYSDTDLHGVYDLNGHDAWSPELEKTMNDSFLENMVQHGPHDNWPDRNSPDLAGLNAGPKPPVTAYLPDGTTQHMTTIDEMKEFYTAHGMDWNSLYPGL